MVEDPRVEKRKYLVYDIVSDLFDLDERGEVMEIAGAQGCGEILMQMARHKLQSRDASSEKSSGQQREAAYLRRYIEDKIQRVIWIDASLAVRPAKPTKEITMSKPQSILEVAESRELMVSAKKAFECIDDLTVVKNAALVLALSEGCKNPGVQIAAQIVEAISGAPSEALLDEYASMLKKFKILAKEVAEE